MGIDKKNISYCGKHINGTEMVDLIELGSKYNWPWRRDKSRTKTANRYKTRRAVITCVFNWEKNGGINTCMEGSDKWNAHAIIYIKDGPCIEYHVLPIWKCCCRSLFLRNLKDFLQKQTSYAAKLVYSASSVFMSIYIYS